MERGLRGVQRKQNTIDRLFHLSRLQETALPRHIAIDVPFILQQAVSPVSCSLPRSIGLMLLSFSVYDGGSTLARI